VTVRFADRLERVTPWIAGAVVLAIGLAIVDRLPVGIVHDDGLYVILAKSLATGQGFRWLQVPGHPAATHFPPGYPLVLALLWLIGPAFPANVVLFKIANAVFLALTAVGTALLAERRFGIGRRPAAALAVVACAGIPTLALSTLVMSEPLYLALLFPTLLLAERVVEAPARARTIVMLALLAAAGTLVRSHGVALIGAVIIVFALRSRVRDAALFAITTLVLLVPWQLWVRANQGVVPVAMRGNYESYGEWFAAGLRSDGLGLVGRTIPRTSAEIAGMFATLTAPSLPGAFRYAALAALAVLLVAGFLVAWKCARVSALFTLLYAAIVIVWPFNPARFIWAIWPLVFVIVVAGARAIAAWRPSPRSFQAARAAAVTASLLLAAGYSVYTARGYRGRWWSSVARQETVLLAPLVAWTRTHTQPGDVIASSAEPVIYLYGGRAAVSASTFTVDDYFRPPSVAESRAALRDILAAYRVDVVAVVAADSLLAAARQMAAEPAPELALRDQLANGLVFTPVQQ
jgi:hypothetical protein